MQSTAKIIARWAALGALFLIPLAPLIVANTFFFPFITGKAFYFRILVEIAVCAWVVLAVIDREYRPRFSWIGAAVLAFVVWMFIADAFAINTTKAFWSNFERMEGWILLVHLLGLFVAASAVFRVEKQWRNWFLASLAVSVVVVGYALAQLTGLTPIHQGSTRIDATLGNSAYLAIYFLFNTFIALWLALTEKSTWLKWSLIILAFVEALLIFETQTRGTVIGLVGGVAVAALLAALAQRGRIRRSALYVLVALVVVVGGFLAIRNTSFIRGNEVFGRIASISLADGQTRFTLWHMAYEGFLARPITGYGQEGFNYVFEKYYEPALYAQEPWFDRAHNAFIDWLVAGGLPALVLYLALFGTALTLLWRSTTLSLVERIALTAAIVGYACHNLFVFDNLYSYIYFFAILALIDSQVGRPIAYFEKLPEADAASALSTALPIAGACAIVLIAFVNYPGMRASGELIQALSTQEGGTAQNFSIFQNLLTHPSFAAQEEREQLVSFATSVAGSASVPTEMKQQVVRFAAAQMAEQIAEHPGDARTLLELSLIYRAGGNPQESLKAIAAAEALAPKKEQIYVQEGATRWDSGDAVGAAAAFDKAYQLGPQFSDLAAYAAAGKFITNHAADGRAILERSFGTTTVDNDALALAYYRTQNYADLIALWRLRTQAAGANADAGFGLAAAYYFAGQKSAAIAQVNATVAKYPAAASLGAQIIAQIEGTTAPAQ